MNKDKFTFYFFLALIAFTIILIAGKGIFTGNVIEEQCSTQEVCTNETVISCDNVCTTECHDITNEVCEPKTEEVCNTNCETINETEVCTDVCENVTTQICENVTNTICEDICEDVNCTDIIVQNCTDELVCVNVTVPDNETTNNILSETNEENTTAIQEINFQDSITAEEISLVKEKTGESIIRTTKSEIVNGRLVLRFEIGEFWIENSYDYPISEEEIKNDIEIAKVRLIKQIANSDSESDTEEKGEYLKNYEI